jgi:hypothetical protein
MSLIILIAGLAGLAVAGYGFVTLVLDASRRRQYLDILLAVVVALAVVAALILYGDRLLR